MLKKTIKYEDFDGNTREEDFYFNLTKAEIIKMETSEKGGLTKLLDQIVKTQDMPQIVEMFEQIILGAYGEKSLDGKTFRKSKEISDQFASTEAYSNLFIELLENPEEAARFIKSIIPKEALSAVEEAEKNGNLKLVTNQE